MIDIQSIVTNGVITFSSCRVRSIGTYPARNLNKNQKVGSYSNFVQNLNKPRYQTKKTANRMIDCFTLLSR